MFVSGLLAVTLWCVGTYRFAKSIREPSGYNCFMMLVGAWCGYMLLAVLSYEDAHESWNSTKGNFPSFDSIYTIPAVSALVIALIELVHKSPRRHWRMVMWAVLTFAAIIQVLGVVTLVMFKDVEWAEWTESGGIGTVIIGILAVLAVLIWRKLRK